LAEDSRLGGTCVIRGCVPKKLMVFASEFSNSTAMAREYGWDATLGDFNWPAFSTKLNAELDRLEGVYRNILTSNNVTVHDQRAHVTGPNEVTLTDGTKITAGHILVATGGRPVRPDLPGAEHAMVSDDIFHMDALPKSVLIIGGGYIACEFACILNGLGVDVTQFYRGAQILRGFDEEARGLISEMVREQGVDLHCGTNIVEMEERDAGFWVKATNGSEHTFEKVLFATGRAPNTGGIGLEEVGVKLNRKGAIEVDKYSQTAVPSIYAIGDVTDRINLTPVAIREGMAFMETVFKNNPTSPDHDLVASAVFTQPELGTVGLSEEAAREQEPIEVYATSFKPMKSAFAGHSERVLMKLIVSQATRRVLGCHIVADGAGELIQMVGIAVKAGLTKEEFDRTVAVHPTMSEELVTMHNPVRTA
jgi:glutathione reductase (NADPH)